MRQREPGRKPGKPHTTYQPKVRQPAPKHGLSPGASVTYRAASAHARRGTLSAAAATVLILASVAGCGGGSGSEANETTSGSTSSEVPGTSLSVPGWVASRLEQIPGEDVQIAFGTSDHAPGRNRIAFAVIRTDAKLVESRRANLIIIRDGAKSGLKVDARLTPLGAGQTDGDDVNRLYVAKASLPQAGRYWLVAEPVGKSIQAAGSIEVKSQSESPAVGAKAIASRNPTVRETPARRITTADPPDIELLQYSIAESLEAKAPFVVAFATPAFCESRTCGPTVDVLEAARRKFERRGIRFIHVEIYEGNTPGNGVNRWVREWNLPSEPWVFVVDRSGTIRAKFEGAVSVAELERAIRANLL